MFHRPLRCLIFVPSPPASHTISTTLFTMKLPSYGSRSVLRSLSSLRITLWMLLLLLSRTSVQVSSLASPHLTPSFQHSPPFRIQQLQRITLPCTSRGEYERMKHFYSNILQCPMIIVEEDTLPVHSHACCSIQLSPQITVDITLEEQEEDDDLFASVNSDPSCSQRRPWTLVLSVTSDPENFLTDPKDHFSSAGGRASTRISSSNTIREYFAQQELQWNTTILQTNVNASSFPIILWDPQGNRIQLELVLAEEESSIEQAGLEENATNLGTDDKGISHSADSTTLPISTQAEISPSQPNDKEEPAQKDTPPPLTPCTRICRYNTNVFDGQVCIGCYREPYEIGTWASMSAEEKYLTLLDALDRQAAVPMDGAITRDELARQAAYWKGRGQ